jgi:ribulose-phosphate 3-epimerase
MRLAPSILSFDLTDLASSVGQLAALEPDAIHLDVMDGSFVPPITFGDAYVKALRAHVRTPFEAHLMVSDPERQFEPFIKAGCSRLIFHAEATPHAHRLVHELKQLGAAAGVAINPGTPVEALLPLIHDIDLALVMTVDPGWGGQSFLRGTLPKVERLRALRPDLTIEVDGGIDPATIGEAAAAGADLFVVGSYLAKAKDIRAAAAQLEAACH